MTFSGGFAVNFKHISHFVLVFLLLTLNKYLPPGMGLERAQGQSSELLNEDMKCNITNSQTNSPPQTFACSKSTMETPE